MSSTEEGEAPGWPGAGAPSRGATGHTGCADHVGAAVIGPNADAPDAWSGASAFGRGGRSPGRGADYVDGRRTVEPGEPGGFLLLVGPGSRPADLLGVRFTVARPGRRRSRERGRRGSRS